MTNSWTDIDNTSMVLVWGANPAENHPACMAHVNAARYGTKAASLVVVDPRKTRTAAQADRYIRIRPGTDIALQNAVIGGIIANMEARDVADAARVKWFAILNQSSAGSFYTDGDATVTAKYVTMTLASSNSKYTDARFIVNTAGSDYEREKIVASTGLPATTETADLTISDFPKKAATVDADANTVYNRLKAHVAPYDSATVADICGCSTADIDFLVTSLIANSRCSSAGTWPVPTGTTPPGVGGDADPTVTDYKCTTILYAMGMTQHTTASTGIKGFANLQTLMGNMGRAGGGINALRGIHNVQGSTDMGLLFGNIPAYSSNPTKMTAGHTDPLKNDLNAFGKYMNSLWGGPLRGTAGGGVAPRTDTWNSINDGSYDAAYDTVLMDWQQRGFYNMVRTWFGDPAWATSVGRTNVNGLYDLWPKGNGDDHVTMFRKMAPGGYTTAALVWGQNPAVTEPNQTAVRAGLYNLETLVVVDMYETETAACDRKPTGVTYLIPACSHVEEAGSVTNSARTLQWRERATTPKGNSKADMELLLRLAYALDNADAFTHITTEWTAKSYTYASAYTSLYGTRFGWTPTAGVDDFDGATFHDAYTQVWHGTDNAPTATTALLPLTGSEAICERIYREEMSLHTAGGCLWIYKGAFNTDFTTDKAVGQSAWLVYNRAKSRDNTNDSSINAFHGWGYSWLVNRRVFYNNGEIPGDVADYFMGPDSVSRLFVSTNTNTLNYSRWYRTIHQLKDMPDVCLPISAVVGGVGGVGTPTAEHTDPGRFPSFAEPYETPKAGDAVYMAKWGRNTKGTAQWDLVQATTAVAGKTVPAAGFPLILTTIRCVEHFQGGPTTRNNSWNLEAEPVPWIEINSFDASTAVALDGITPRPISDGEWVNVITARSNSVSDQQGRTPNSPTGWARGFKARVGVGLDSNQRVARGVVAIPWHWGDKGLGTGSRANDLCIDAGDANSVIPEYKACLCRIVRV